MNIDRALTELHTARSRVDESQQALAAAKQALQRAALQALLAVHGDDGGQRELVRKLYWDVPEVAVNTIEAVLGGSARVRQFAGPGPLLGDCDVCGAEVHATSRTGLASGMARCATCKPEPVAPRYDEPRWSDFDEFDDLDLLLPPPPPP